MVVEKWWKDGGMVEGWWWKDDGSGRVVEMSDRGFKNLMLTW